MNEKTIDPGQVLRGAREAVRRGSFEEALSKYEWVYENALAHDLAFSGVRNSYVIGEWARLGDVYPQARLNLEAVRDTKTARLRDRLQEGALFADISAINEVLGQFDLTATLFAEIAERDQKVAIRCFPSARIALVRTQKYALARSFIRSPLETLKRLAGTLNDDVRDRSEIPSTRSKDLETAVIDNYIEDVQHLMEILDGVGESDEAQSLRMIAIQSVDDLSARDRVRSQLKLH